MSNRTSTTVPSMTSSAATQQKPRVLPVRVVAARVLAQVIDQQRTLAQVMPKALLQVSEQEQSYLQALCFGCLRWYPRLKQIYIQLIHEPLSAKDTDVEALVMLGLFQLLYLRTPDHAVIDTSVEAARRLQKPWATKLINALLRRFQREKEAILAQADGGDMGQTAHPKWLIKAIRRDWPEQAEAIFSANNDHPPFTIRVNRQRGNRSQYLQQLKTQGLTARAADFSSDAITLSEAVNVNRLSGFFQGAASVQDEAAQLAATLLDLAPEQSVLDACCAPGGKTGHICEVEPKLGSLWAVDISEARLKQVEENLHRLGVTYSLSDISIPEASECTGVHLAAADVAEANRLAENLRFDRILLDAPCSATGVIRRHPDIKALRLANDIASLAQLQQTLLQRLWQHLKPGGRLVYATCSIFPQENSNNIEAFLLNHADARERKIVADWGIEQTCGRQLLPQPRGHDGFYYAVLEKCNA